MKTGSPSVRIQKEALLTMLLAAIETFPKECIGYIFGKRPTRKRKHYLITNAIPIQQVAYRANDKVGQHDHSSEQLSAIFAEMPKLYSALGSFHSHPEGRKKIRTPLELYEMGTISEADKKNMWETGEEVGIVVTISCKEKLIDEWRMNRLDAEGSIEGILGKYNFYLTAHVPSKKQKGGKVAQETRQIRISAPHALRALNIAQKRITRKKRKK